MASPTGQEMTPCLHLQEAQPILVPFPQAHPSARLNRPKERPPFVVWYSAALASPALSASVPILSAWQNISLNPIVALATVTPLKVSLLGKKKQEKKSLGHKFSDFRFHRPIKF